MIENRKETYIYWERPQVRKRKICKNSSTFRSEIQRKLRGCLGRIVISFRKNPARASSSYCNAVSSSSGIPSCGVDRHTLFSRCRAINPPTPHQLHRRLHRLIIIIHRVIAIQMQHQGILLPPRSTIKMEHTYRTQRAVAKAVAETCQHGKKSVERMWCMKTWIPISSRVSSSATNSKNISRFCSKYGTRNHRGRVNSSAKRSALSARSWSKAGRFSHWISAIKVAVSHSTKTSSLVLAESSSATKKSSNQTTFACSKFQRRNSNSPAYSWTSSCESTAKPNPTKNRSSSTNQRARWKASSRKRLN